MTEQPSQTTSYSRIHVEPTAGPLGAEISGVDLAALDDATFAEIHSAWLEHQVVFFRDQRLSPDDQVAFSSRFGELEPYPFLAALDGHPNVIPIIKEKDTVMNFGGGWHSDMSYQAEPVMATCLYAIEVPSSGGDTLFASMTAAYDALSSGMHRLLDGVQGVFTAAKVHGSAGLYDNADHPMKKATDTARAHARHLHPIVRTHPETGRKGVYLDLPHVEKLEGMTVYESQPLMEFLYKHATQDEFMTRFEWEPGTLAIWDNRCVQHYALNDYAGSRREMNRVTIKGDVPF